MMKVIGYFVSIVAYLTAAAIWSGYVLSVLWSWFVISQFPDMPHLSIPGAIGISMIVSFLTKDRQLTVEQKELDATERFIHGVVVSFSMPALALFLGWIVRMFL